MRPFLISLGALAIVASVAPIGADNTPPTFYKDVLPILQNNCQTCHRPGEVAPMSLLTYERRAALGASAIKTATSAKQMPPWFADPDYGHFANERKLSTRDIATLAAWADAGAPAGDAKDAPAPLHVRERLEHQARRDRRDAEAVRDSGAPAPSTTSTSLVKTNFKEDMWVVAAEMRPGNPKVLHHGKVWVRPPGSHVDEGRGAGRGVRERDAARHDRQELAGRRQRHPRQVQSRDSARSASIRKARRSSCRRDRISSTKCITRRRASRTSDVSKLGLVLAKADPPKKRYYFHAGPTATQPRDSAGRRQRGSGERSDLGAPRRSWSTRSRTCTCAARTSSCA